MHSPSQTTVRPMPGRLQGSLSHWVWDDGRAWGDRPLMTYLDALERHRREKPHAVFLDFEGQTVTFAELDERSTRMANALIAYGVRKGDTVVTLLDNSEDLVLTMVAVNKLGGIWVPINTAYRGEFLRHQMADADAALAICEDDYLGEILAIAGRVPKLEQVVVRNLLDRPPSDVPVHSLDTIRGSDTTPIAVTIDPEDIACLIYTSGTTGPSKGCMISHNYLCSIGARRNRSVTPSAGEVTWSCLPLFHIASLGALLIANLLAGERASVGLRFSVRGFWGEIERSGATSAILLASMLPLVAHAPDTPEMARCRGQLRVITGVPLSSGDRQIWQERFGVSYVNTFAYGQTEANLVSLLPWGAPLPPLESMGPPSEDFDVMVMGADERPVAIGDTGELLVRPRHPSVLFSGYWRQPNETLKAMKDFWWRTGDFVRMDENGFLYFVDRKKDYLRSRGENISSFEVESAVTRHQWVLEAAFHTVGGEPGKEEDLKATLVLIEGASVTEQELFEWARENLPYFAVPRYVEFRLELPKTPTGRVQKHELRAEGKTVATWDALAAGLEIRRGRSVRT